MPVGSDIAVQIYTRFEPIDSAPQVQPPYELAQQLLLRCARIQVGTSASNERCQTPGHYGNRYADMWCDCTSRPLYLLDNDLQNDLVYLPKCLFGEGRPSVTASVKC